MLKLEKEKIIISKNRKRGDNMEEQNTNQNPEPQAAPQSEQATPVNEAPAPQAAPTPGNSDVENNKLMAIVGYILPILFFVPLISESGKNSPFAKYHANQQLLLLIFAIAVNVVGSIIPFLGWFLILPIGSIAALVLMVLGIINAAKGETKPLPMIGGFKIV